MYLLVLSKTVSLYAIERNEKQQAIRRGLEFITTRLGPEKL